MPPAIRVNEQIFTEMIPFIIDLNLKRYLKDKKKNQAATNVGFARLLDLKKAASIFACCCTFGAQN